MTYTCTHENFDLSKIFQSHIEHMGYTYKYGHVVPPDYDPKLVNTLWDTPIETLIQYVESTETTLPTRYFSGYILSLKGDTRITVYEPKMAKVQAGTVCLGRDEQEIISIHNTLQELDIDISWFKKETPSFETHINDFALGIYAVTNLEYLTFLRHNPEMPLPSSWLNGRFPIDRANHPVYSINRDTAKYYTKWLSKITGRHFRLPTEYEWEFAASGPNRYNYPWGNTYAQHHANTVEEGIFETTAIGTWAKGVSVFGCYDMAGNIMEWVDGDYHPYPGGNIIQDWFVKNDAKHPILRGGAYNGYRDLARCHRRYGLTAWSCVGFRLAETIR